MSDVMELFEEVQAAINAVVRTCEGCRWRGAGCATCPAMLCGVVKHKLDEKKWRMIMNGTVKDWGAEYDVLQRGRPASKGMDDACAEVLRVGKSKPVLTRGDVRSAIRRVGATLANSDVTKRLLRKGLIRRVGDGQFECVALKVQGKRKCKQNKEQS